MAKKSKKRPSRSSKHGGQANKAKQQQHLHKQQQQQQQQQSLESSTAPSGRLKTVSSSVSSSFAGASSSSRSSRSSVAFPTSTVGGGAAANAPTGSGPPAHPWDPTQDLATRGLLNLGNTCFFNAALQNIFKTKLLHEALFGDDSERRQGAYVGPLNKSLRKVLLEMSGEGLVGARRG